MTARLGALAVVATLALIPTDWIRTLAPVCAWRILLGIECLGCGMTRALSSALHGDLSTALAFNRGVLVVLPALVAMAIGGVHDMLPRCISRSLDSIPALLFRHTEPTNQPASTSPLHTI